MGRGRTIRLLEPTDITLEHGRDVTARVNGRMAPVRNGFMERWLGSDDPPPLARMLGGGQGGGVRLKFLLSLIWFSARSPHDTKYPARGWAALLGLDEPETNGARRITAATKWLAEHGFVTVTARPGTPSVVFLRDERGNGRAYKIPALALQEKEAKDEEPTRDDYWIRLLPELWTKGWISVLRAPAVAMLLVLLNDGMRRRNFDGIWHSPAQAAERFGLSQDTRTDGLLELEAYGIVDKRRTSVSPGVFDYKRVRNVYDLHLEQLLVLPGEERPEKRFKFDELADTAEDDEVEELV